jgi:ADP-ribose pyrophosphatase
MTFTQVGERLVHRGQVIDLAVGTFAGPDGDTFERDIVRHPGAVSVVAVDERGHAVLVHQYRPALDAVLPELPAGKLDVDGEDPMVCAQRELVEEVGLAAGSWELLVEFHNSPGFSDELHRVYLARDLHEVPHDRQGVEEQAMTVSWLPLAETVDRIRSGELKDAKTCIGLLLARELLDLR